MMGIDITIRHYDRQLLIYVVLLAIIGTVMLYSASWYESFARSNGRTDMLFLQGHLKRLLLGIVFLFGFLIVDFRELKKIAPHLIVFAILLLITTKGYYLINGWNRPARWLYIGSLSVQTSDIARFSVLLYIAYFIDKKRGGINEFNVGLLPALAVLIIIMGLIIIQPDFSTAIMIGILGITILYIGGSNLSQLSLSTALGLIISIPILLSESYRMDRITSYLGRISSFFNPTDIKGVGYQLHQSLISLGNGGWFGVGLGGSIEKNHILPAPHTDFIFSIIGEELGLILGTVPVLTIFLLIFLRGIKISKECTDPFGVLLAVGISINLILYAYVNVAVVTGLIPVTGLPMPLVSYGGSGMVVNLAMIGILLNISQARRTVGNRNTWSPLQYER